MNICGAICEGWEGPGPWRKEGYPALLQALLALAAEGTEEFVISIDRGPALWCARELLARRRSAGGAYRVTCLLPWEEQAVDWPESVREVWFDTVASCDGERLLDRRRRPETLERRDRFLVETCGCLLAAWNGGDVRLGKTIGLALSRGVPVLERAVRP